MADLRSGESGPSQADGGPVTAAPPRADPPPDSAPPDSAPSDSAPPDGAPPASSLPQIRRATPADAAALAEFAARLFRETYGPAADPAQGGGSRAEDVEAYVGPHFHPARQGEELADPALATFVADAGAGGLAAYAQVRVPSPHAAAGPRAAELARFYVDARWRGRGLAARLLDAVATHARAAGAPALWLAAQQRNARALAFYRREGFAVVGTATFRMGAEVQDDWILARPLS